MLSENGQVKSDQFAQLRRQILVIAFAFGIKLLFRLPSPVKYVFYVCKPAVKLFFVAYLQSTHNI